MSAQELLDQAVLRYLLDHQYELVTARTIAKSVYKTQTPSRSQSHKVAGSLSRFDPPWENKGHPHWLFRDWKASQSFYKLTREGTVAANDRI